MYKYTPIYSDGGKPELIEDDVFRITIPLDKMAADEAREQKILSENQGHFPFIGRWLFYDKNYDKFYDI